MFTLDLVSRVPIYEQIIEQTSKLISLKVLKPGDKLPSVRSLSVALGVNPNTIQRAYTDMCSNGLIYTVAGRGCFVSEYAKDSIKEFAENELTLLEEKIHHLFLSGISKNTLIKLIEKIYSTKEKDND